MTDFRIRDIRTDGNTQSRVEIDPNVVNEYIEAMQNGDIFPPVVVYQNDDGVWLADGFHRLAAAKALGRQWINAEIRQGSQLDAQWQSFGANKDHGLRRSQADKERAVKAALLHPNGANMSDGAIAKHTGVSAPTVAKYRKELIADSKISESAERVGADGRTINTAQIGKTNSELWSDDEQLVERFWKLVKGFQLEGEQEALSKLLNNKRLEFKEVSSRLSTLALERTTRMFPRGAYVLNEDTGEIGIVVIQYTTELDVDDRTAPRYLSWKISDKLKIVTREDEIAYFQSKQLKLPDVESNPFKVDDRVSFEGRKGTIRYIKEDRCGVYFDESKTTHYYEWNKLEAVAAPAPAQAAPGLLDWVITRTGHIGQIVADSGGAIVKVETINGITPHKRGSLTITEAPSEIEQQVEQRLAEQVKPEQDDKTTILILLYERGAAGLKWTSHKDMYQALKRFITDDLEALEAVGAVSHKVEAGGFYWRISPIGCGMIGKDNLSQPSTPGFVPPPKFNEASRGAAVRINQYLIEVRDVLRDLASVNPDLTSELAISYLTLRQQVLDVLESGVQVDMADVFGVVMEQAS